MHGWAVGLPTGEEWTLTSDCRDPAVHLLKSTIVFETESFAFCIYVNKLLHFFKPGLFELERKENRKPSKLSLKDEKNLIG